jgi:hypothetical protein
MNTDDPVADVPPEEVYSSEAQPVVSTASGFLGYALLMFFILLLYRMAWYSVETIVFEALPMIKDFSTFILIIWLIPVFGLMASVVNPSMGGTLAWIIAMSVILGITWFLSLIYVYMNGVPPQAMALLTGNRG